jgi:flagellar hook-associated protein 3 FlgL
MRITNRMIVDNTVNNLTGAMDRLYELQKQNATHKKYLKASDNPSNAASVFTLKSALQTSTVYEETAQSTNDWMDATDFSLQQATDKAQTAISGALRGLSDTSGADTRATIAEEINGLLKEVIDIANTKHLGRYVFSGFTTDTQPFTATLANPADPNSTITAVQYKDGTPATQAFQAIRRDIGPGETVTVNIDGYTTFQGLVNSMIAVRDSLAANDLTTLRTATDDLNTAFDQVSLASTINGSRIRDLEGAQDRISESNVELKALLSQKEDANMAEVTAELANQENIYQTVVTISSRTQSMVNLFESLG